MSCLPALGGHFNLYSIYPSVLVVVALIKHQNYFRKEIVYFTILNQRAGTEAEAMEELLTGLLSSVVSSACSLA